MLPLRSSALAVLLGVLTHCGKETPPSSNSSDSTIDESVSYATNAYARVKDDVERLSRSVERSPNDARLRIELGRTLLNGGIQHRGSRELERALELDPKAIGAATLLARARLTLGDLDRASSVVNKALENGENGDLRAIQAEILLRRDPNDRVEARRLLELALAKDPNNVEATYQLGIVRSRDGANEEAERLLRKTTKLAPNHLGAHFNLARVLRALGRDAEAEVVGASHKRLAILETLGQLHAVDSVESYAGVAQVLSEGGDREGALAELERGIEVHPNAPVLRVKKALALIQGERVEEGRKYFETSLRQIPDDPMLANQYAWYLATARNASDDDRRRAVKLAEKAVGLTKRRDPNMLDTLAEARAASGDSNGAVSAMDEAIKLKPGDPTFQKRRQEFAKRGEPPR